MWFTMLDQGKVLNIAPSILDFLRNHNTKLKNTWYNNTKEEIIETYSRVPTDPGAFGSVTITNGVKITACAFYNHHISSFSDGDHDHYQFSYQIKISVEEEDEPAPVE